MNKLLNKQTNKQTIEQRMKSYQKKKNNRQTVRQTDSMLSKLTVCGCERVSQIYERRVKSGARGEYPH